MDELLIRTVMALYTEACTVVRTDAGVSESFEVKAGLCQWSVLSPLLFAVVMNVVSSEARSGLLSGLYADEIVGISGRNMIVNSGKWPCNVCGSRQTLFSTQYVQIEFTRVVVLYMVTCRW